MLPNIKIHFTSLSAAVIMIRYDRRV